MISHSMFFFCFFWIKLTFSSEQQYKPLAITWMMELVSGIIAALAVTKHSHSNDYNGICGKMYMSWSIMNKSHIEYIIKYITV